MIDEHLVVHIQAFLYVSMVLMPEEGLSWKRMGKVYLLRLDAAESRLFLLFPEDDEWSAILILGVDGVHSLHGVAVLMQCSGREGRKEREWSEGYDE